EHGDEEHARRSGEPKPAQEPPAEVQRDEERNLARDRDRDLLERDMEDLRVDTKDHTEPAPHGEERRAPDVAPELVRECEVGMFPRESPQQVEVNQRIA